MNTEDRRSKNIHTFLNFIAHFSLFADKLFANLFVCLVSIGNGTKEEYEWNMNE